MTAKEEKNTECNYCDKGCVGAFECWDCNGTGFIIEKDE